MKNSGQSSLARGISSVASDKEGRWLVMHESVGEKEEVGDDATSITSTV